MGHRGTLNTTSYADDIVVNNQIQTCPYDVYVPMRVMENPSKLINWALVDSDKFLKEIEQGVEFKKISADSLQMLLSGKDLYDIKNDI